jgi:uncharacterized membrane protein
MRKYFITGLVLLLPLALTFIIVLFLFNLLTEPFVGIVQGIFNYYGLFQNGVLFLSAGQIQLVISRIVILILLFFFTALLGLFTRLVFMHYIIRFWDYLLHKIPFVRTIYKTCQDVISTIFKSDTSSFKQVVIVPFPYPEPHSVGLVTRENFNGVPERLGTDRVAVFVPTTPNPTSGFLMMFEAKDLIYLDMSVEDAFKYIISCGVIASPFRAITREEAIALSKARKEA